METRRLLLALFVLLALGGVASAQVAPTSAAAPSRLRIELVLSGRPSPPRVVASAMEEARGIWAAYGVDVFIADANEIAQDSDVSLEVMLADRPSQPMASSALGSIVFLDDEPQPAIAIYMDAIDALISTVTIAGSHNLEWPIAFRDAIVGRVLGRALAHEIGHFLLRERHHADSGLMRAPHRVLDLVAADRQNFRLSVAERTRLVLVSARLRSAPAAVRATAANAR
jgi:hypothetical protein